ncbi:MAG: AAA family ATPase [Chitinophagales bacterium]
MPDLYIIAGPNGAGKTTASVKVLPKMLDCQQFINADIIAADLAPDNPESAAMAAGRIMLLQVKELLRQGETFALETTLATRSYVSLIKDAQAMGYEVTLIYFWLDSVETARQRVKKRVAKGGHNIPENIIDRRYDRGLSNFFSFYQKHSDFWLLVDNSKPEWELIADGQKQSVIQLKNTELYDQIKSQALAIKSQKYHP